MPPLSKFFFCIAWKTEQKQNKKQLLLGTFVVNLHISLAIQSKHFELILLLLHWLDIYILCLHNTFLCEKRKKNTSSIHTLHLMIG